MIIIEHSILALKIVMAIIIPDEPIEIKRDLELREKVIENAKQKMTKYKKEVDGITFDDIKNIEDNE